MKSFILSILLLTLIVNVSVSQITVTNATFPKIGDVLKTVTTSTPSAPINVGNVNGPQTWFFNQLNKGDRINVVCKAPSSSPDFVGFPTADLLLVDGDDQEQFMDVTSNKISVIGFGGANGILPVPVRISFSQSPTYRRAPISFIQSSSSLGKFNLDLGTDILPDSLISSFPIALDSIRIQFSSEESGIVDAFGTVKMQGKDTEVLREKVQVITDTKLFVKVPFVGWIDASQFLGGGGGIPGGGGLGDFLGRDTSVVFNFYSQSNKEILVSAEFGNDNTFRSVTFADIGGIVSSTIDQKLIAESMTCYPNPASESINLSVKDVKADQYMLVITDASGKIIQANFETIHSNWSKQIDVSDLRSGIYLIQMINKNRTQSYTTKVVKK